MSQLGLGMTPDEGRSSSRRERTGGSGRRAVVVALVAVLALGVIGVVGIKALVGGTSDYTGSGSGSVTVVVAKGDTLRQIGRALAAAGVVASDSAFVDAAGNDPRAAGIAPGTYLLHSQMSGRDALDLMLDPSSLSVSKLVIPEGWRLDRTVAAVVKATGLTDTAVRASLAKADSLGLPAYAHGNPEGFLVPATYDLAPGGSADAVVSAMLARYQKMADQSDLENQASARGLTPLQVITIASILEIEAAPSDYAKASRVIYNRLKAKMPLQLDSTVNYALGLSSLHLTAAQLATQSPYNTYLHKGLPPGPINSPGDAAIQAALNPAPGTWLYWVTTDPKTHKTEFATTYDQFLVLKKKFQASGG